MNALVAIDFTKSNGDPSLPSSLHHREGSNPYSTAISSVRPPTPSRQFEFLASNCNFNPHTHTLDLPNWFTVAIVRRRCVRSCRTTTWTISSLCLALAGARPLSPQPRTASPSTKPTRSFKSWG